MHHDSPHIIHMHYERYMISRLVKSSSSRLGSKHRQARRLEVGVDLVKVVDELALEVIPHLRLVLCVGASRVHQHGFGIGREAGRTVKLPGALHAKVCVGHLHARLEHER